MAVENKIRIITRKSPLALAQTREILDSFPGIPHKIIVVETLGDRNKQIPLSSEEVPGDFFTRELDDAVLRGRADVAVHSAKDLPAPLKAGLEVIALTKAGDSSDSLVSGDNLPLKKLKIGARVGASSESRKSQLLGIRPDLKVVSVRGVIEERLFLVESGRIDALVVATCALKRLGLASRITEILRFQTHPLQGMLAVTAKNSRADMKVFFSKIDARRSWGKVYIVGAGSGGRNLLTVRAKNILERADIIFYDDLIDENLLDDYHCRKTYIGKRKGRHSSPQSRINEMLFAAAQKKQIVARLKGGDPFIFGRGGEEYLYLRERHIDVEIVPGITAAQGAAASAGVPLTMRGISRQLCFLSGHYAENILPRPREKDAETIVFYMAASKITEVKNSLLKRGFDADTPAILVRKAGFSDEKVTATDIQNMAAARQKSPLAVIVGKTAGLYAPRNKVLFTGLDPYNCFVPGRLIHYPLIEIRPISFDADIKNYDGIVFTSRSAVRIFCLRHSISKKHKIISIGPQTSGELKNYGYKVDYESEFPDSDVLAGSWNALAIKKLKLQKVLYPCSNLSDNEMHYLPAVEAKVVYKTVAQKQPRLNLKMFSGVVFSSSSTVEAFIKIYKTIPKHLVLFVYGRHTAAKLAERGYEKNVQTVSPEQN
ncbi:MAG: uroporphyrinogen-III C-methyltransferase [Endomicrobiia bacterium]|nr:uroporphyrinogen-III C-methyltransferase [Endomicrobiia bacterium]